MGSSWRIDSTCAWGAVVAEGGRDADFRMFTLQRDDVLRVRRGARAVPALRQRAPACDRGRLRRRPRRSLRDARAGRPRRARLRRRRRDRAVLRALPDRRRRTRASAWWPASRTTCGEAVCALLAPDVELAVEWEDPRLDLRRLRRRPRRGHVRGAHRGDERDDQDPRRPRRRDCRRASIPPSSPATRRRRTRSSPRHGATAVCLYDERALPPEFLEVGSRATA